MMLRFEGATPTDDEVAAILTVLCACRPQAAPQPVTSAWKRSALRPELSYDELRAAAQGATYAP